MVTYEEFEKKFIEASSRRTQLEEFDRVIQKIEADEFGFGTANDVGRGPLYGFVLPTVARESAKAVLLESLRDSRHIIQCDLDDLLRDVVFNGPKGLPSGIVDLEGHAVPTEKPAYLRKIMD